MQFDTALLQLCGKNMKVITIWGWRCICSRHCWTLSLDWSYISRTERKVFQSQMKVKGRWAASSSQRQTLYLYVTVSFPTEVQRFMNCRSRVCFLRMTRDWRRVVVKRGQSVLKIPTDWSDKSAHWETRTCQWLNEVSELFKSFLVE